MRRVASIAMLGVSSLFALPLSGPAGVSRPLRLANLVLRTTRYRHSAEKSDMDRDGAGCTAAALSNGIAPAYHATNRLKARCDTLNSLKCFGSPIIRDWVGSLGGRPVPVSGEKGQSAGYPLRDGASDLTRRASTQGRGPRRSRHRCARPSIAGRPPKDRLPCRATVATPSGHSQHNRLAPPPFTKVSRTLSRNVTICPYSGSE